MNDVRPRIKSRDGKWIHLEESPSVNATDEWLMALGCHKTIVGNTVQGRDIPLYWLNYEVPADSAAAARSSVLFLSMVHGNEPMGLISLLMGAKLLASSSSVPTEKTSSIRIYFLPIVNVDAYELNRGRPNEEGCWRPNLRPTCVPGLSDTNINKTTTFIDSKSTRLGSCNLHKNDHSLGNGGVDLNRNFPTGWASNEDKCSYNYAGPYPLSEPETQAIASVVENFEITHAMSLHSRSNNYAQPLLLHPYASTRPFSTMNPIDARRFRTWSSAMTRDLDNYYVTGTALEAIKYSAGGTTIDWMYSKKKVVSFVLEVVPPCDQRWCQGIGVYQNANFSATTMKTFVSLAVDQNYYETPLQLLLLLFLLGTIYSIIKWRRHNCRLFFYRFGLPIPQKEKNYPTEDKNVEMASLVV